MESIDVDLEPEGAEVKDNEEEKFAELDLKLFLEDDSLDEW